MEDTVETALRYALATLLALGGMRFYYEYVKLCTLRDVVRERPTLLTWVHAGLVPSFLMAVFGAYGISQGTALGAHGDFAFWFTYLLFILLVLVSFARQAARREGAKPGDRLLVSSIDPIAWLRKKMTEDEEGPQS